MNEHFRTTGAPAPVHRPLAELAAEPLMTRDFDARPQLVYERLRHRYGPVAPVDLLGVPVWLVVGHAEVMEVLRNITGAWSKRPRDWRAMAEGRVPPDWPLLPVAQGDGTTFLEGHRLSVHRAAWSEALRPFEDRTQPQARRLETAVTRYADDLIALVTEGAADTGFADLASLYARPLPLMVASQMLGLDDQQSDDVLMDMWRLLDAGPDAAVASERILTAMSALCAAKLVRPGEDILSYLLTANRGLGVEEVAWEVSMLIVMIGDFTANLIANTVTELIVSGDRDPRSAATISDAINRAALANPPVSNLSFRFATRDTVLGAYTIASGDPVMVSVAAAHSDPAFSGGHLAWGAGPHHCLGRELATTITTIAAQRLFGRLGRVELALAPDQLPWRPSPFVRGLRSLPVRYHLDGPALPAEPAAQPGRERSLWRFLRGLRRRG